MKRTVQKNRFAEISRTSQLSDCSHKPYILLEQQALPSMNAGKRRDWLRTATLRHKTEDQAWPSGLQQIKLTDILAHFAQGLWHLLQERRSFGNLHLDYFEYTKVTSCLNFPLLFLAVFALFWGSMWCSPSQETRVWKRIQHWYITPRSATTVPYSPAWIAVNDCLSFCWDGVICAVDTVLCLNHPSWVFQKTCNLDKKDTKWRRKISNMQREASRTRCQNTCRCSTPNTPARESLSKMGTLSAASKGIWVGVKFIS